LQRDPVAQKREQVEPYLQVLGATSREYLIQRIKGTQRATSKPFCST
jgi:hypothetical protein